MATQARGPLPAEPATKRAGGGTFASFAPWIVYWILAGNVHFRVAIFAAGAVAALNTLHGARGGRTPKVLDIGSAIAFVALFAVTFVVDQAVLQRWMQPLTNGALCAIALVSVLIGRPFALQYAKEEAPPEVWEEPLFLHTVNVITWVWIAAFAVMTASSMVPPLLDWSATLHDEQHPLGVVFYWVVPALALACGILFTKWYAERVQRRASAA